jgi:hypothetical protein
LAVLALLAVTLQSLVFSGASFSDVDSTSASFTAGSVSHSILPSGTFALNADPIRAGGTKTAVLTITGGPDVAASYTLSRIGLVDVPASAAFSNVLRLTVDDVTGGAPGSNLYDGVAGGFGSVTLGVIANGQSRQYLFTLRYPAAQATRALMGASMTMELEFVGVSQ